MGMTPQQFHSYTVQCKEPACCVQYDSIELFCTQRTQNCHKFKKGTCLSYSYWVDLHNCESITLSSWRCSVSSHNPCSAADFEMFSGCLLTWWCRTQSTFQSHTLLRSASSSSHSSSDYKSPISAEYSAHNAFVLGELQMTFSESQCKQGHKWRRDDNRTAKLEKPNHQRSSAAKYTHVEPPSHATVKTLAGTWHLVFWPSSTWKL